MALVSSYDQNNGLILNYSGLFPEAGCDEAGRGCLAGPVTAAAVIFPADIRIDGLNDSKKLNAAARYKYRDKIIESCLAWSVAHIGHAQIDEINILQASILAMHRALDQLGLSPAHIMVDGIHFNHYSACTHTCLPKADALIQSVAAASILAKTFRDEYMEGLHKEFPHYGWDRNKGYPTAEHRDAIALHGLSPYHRKTFGRNRQLELDIR